MILLVSSMLISPLMRPIIAIIFGIVIEDHVLIRFGWANEMFGVFLATAVGFVFGLIVHSLDLYSHTDGNALVTEEMISRLVSSLDIRFRIFSSFTFFCRCEIHSLIVGILTALPSGAAVAIAILGENIGSLVGVAISASILPPAVNTVILFGFYQFGFISILINSFPGNFLVDGRFALIKRCRKSNDDQIELFFGSSKH